MLTDFGRWLRGRCDSCADELLEAVPRWTDDQRRAAERVLCAHLLSAHGQGMRDCARMIRLDPHLSLSERNRIADEIDQRILDRREFV